MQLKLTWPVAASVCRIEPWPLPVCDALKIAGAVSRNGNSKAAVSTSWCSTTTRTLRWPANSYGTMALIWPRSTNVSSAATPFIVTLEFPNRSGYTAFTFGLAFSAGEARAVPKIEIELPGARSGVSEAELITDEIAGGGGGSTRKL